MEYEGAKYNPDPFISRHEAALNRFIVFVHVRMRTPNAKHAFIMFAIHHQQTLSITSTTRLQTNWVRIIVHSRVFINYGN